MQGRYNKSGFVTKAGKQGHVIAASEPSAVDYCKTLSSGVAFAPDIPNYMHLPRQSDIG